VDTAEGILLRTTLFEVGGMPEKRQVQAFNVVFDQRDALERFRRVARHARPAGRLYAFCALLELSPLEAEKLQAELVAMPGEIPYFDHDVVFTRRVSDLANLILAKRLGSEFRRSRGEVEAHFRRTGDPGGPSKHE
jgi:hypothetical protein